jgi:uncharacterized protein YggU (UPF0235/DUF167 family)
MGKDGGRAAGLRAPERTTPAAPEYPLFLKVLPEGQVALTVRAKPGCKHCGLTLEGEELVLSTSAPPRDGEANAALVQYLADVLEVRHTAVTHCSGSKSRSKVFKLSGLTPEEVLQKLKAAEAAG